VKKGDRLAEWDPFNEPFVTDVAGTVQFTDIVEGRTVQEKTDEATGKSTLTITEFRSSNFRPSISICDEHGVCKTKPDTGTAAAYTLPVGAIIMVNDGDQVSPGDIIARKPRETSKTKDIVGGLPRVAELFEVRKPKDQAILVRNRRYRQLWSGFQGQAQGHRRARGGRGPGVSDSQGQAHHGW
jgi:DNA-directed RNA polymerase subunit beta'